MRSKASSFMEAVSPHLRGEPIAYGVSMAEGCIFCGIAAGSIPARLAHEDAETIAFHDIEPRAPVHMLITPRRHIASINDMNEADAPLLGKLHVVAQKLAREFGIAESGYRLVINTGSAAGQTVDHIHLHLLGGRPLKWPPG